VTAELSLARNILNPSTLFKSRKFGSGKRKMGPKMSKQMANQRRTAEICFTFFGAGVAIVFSSSVCYFLGIEVTNKRLLYIAAAMFAMSRKKSWLNANLLFISACFGIVIQPIVISFWMLYTLRNIQKV
jgi:hypothetical protein